MRSRLVALSYVFAILLAAVTALTKRKIIAAHEQLPKNVAPFVLSELE